MKIVVLGAGFGGLEIAAGLSEEFGESLDLTLVDRASSFMFGFSKFDLVFDRSDRSRLDHRYSDLAKPGLQASVVSIDPARRVVETDQGSLEADILVVALGADYDVSATPGLAEGGSEFYSIEGAARLGKILPSFTGGRVVVGVSSTPFKCPPAPSEAALLMHEYLLEREIRAKSSIALVMPFPTPVPPAPEASEALLAAFAERDIEWHPDRAVVGLEPDRKVARLDDGSEIAYDLYLGVPVHKVPDVVERSGLTVDGWVPVDPRTLETAFPGVYALGDVTSVGTPKAGVFTEGQAKVVASAIAARLHDRVSDLRYDGRAICHVEFGNEEVGEVDVTFPADADPHGAFRGPSRELFANKSSFGDSRVQRWFDRPWKNIGRVK
jgi:sulfide:quinone oxidoreductase